MTDTGASAPTSSETDRGWEMNPAEWGLSVGIILIGFSVIAVAAYCWLSGATLKQVYWFVLNRRGMCSPVSRRKKERGVAGSDVNRRRWIS